MTSMKKIVPVLLCAVAVVGAAVPASAEPFRGGWGHAGWHDHWGPGRTFAIGGLGLAAGALIASAYARPAYARPAYAACGSTVSSHYNARGELVRVVTQNPC